MVVIPSEDKLRVRSGKTMVGCAWQGIAIFAEVWVRAPGATVAAQVLLDLQLKAGAAKKPLC